MGFNYGQKRNRMQDLNVADPLLGYALSDQNLDFEKYDIQQVTDKVNEKLDRAADKLKNRSGN